MASGARRSLRGQGITLGLLLLGIATLTRFTNLPVLLPVGLLALWNQTIFGHPLRLGYPLSHSMIALSPDAIPTNIQRLSAPLLLALPLFPVALWGGVMQERAVQSGWAFAEGRGPPSGEIIPSVRFQREAKTPSR